MWAAGAAAIAGAIALQDSPGGRVPLVIVVSLQMGAAVFLGALTAAYAFVFVVVVAVWCLAAGMQWALGEQRRTGRRGCNRTARDCATAGTVGVIRSGADGTDVRGGLRAGGADRGVAAATVAGAARRVDTGIPVIGRRCPPCLPRTVRRRWTRRQLTWLRDAFVDSQASRRPKAYHGGYRLPERIDGDVARTARRRRTVTRRPHADADRRGRAFSTRSPITASPLAREAEHALDPGGRSGHVDDRAGSSNRATVLTAVARGGGIPVSRHPSTRPDQPTAFGRGGGAQPPDVDITDPAACRPALGGGCAGRRRRPVRAHRPRFLDRADGPAGAAPGNGTHIYPLCGPTRGHRRRNRGRIADRDAVAADGVCRGGPRGACVSR